MPLLNSTRLATLAAIVSLSMSTARADQVVMKNGDRVTGSIVKKDGKDLVVKSELFGTVTMAWDQVDSITADKPVNVVLQGGRTVRGTMSTSAGRVEITGDSGRVGAALADVTALRDADEQRGYERLQHPSMAELWAGAATLGLAGTAGNARTLTFTTGVSAARATRTDKTSLYFNAIKATAVANGKSAETAEAVRGGVSYDHNISSRMFVNVFNDYEYDRFQNLDLRFVLGGGLGFHAVKTDKSRLDLLAGGDFNHSKFSTPLTRNDAEFFWGNEYALKVTTATSIIQTFRMFNNLSQTGIYRVSGDVSAATKISKWLTWTVSLSDRYLSDPAPGRKTNDFLYTTGLGITFAR